ncbi:hypothetical protein SAY86_010776 [Trapa natans]|uniref:BHLH domain-containing protein n=1 Tax=Trapa natans TaxID=22666 RepID=A0AAN7LF90_TRANT|nr:hypothetical protein SAY86_010776 [Trapa natans]
MNMEMRGNPSLLASSLRADRKTIERNRRNHMKSLFNTLNSLIQRQNPTEVSSLPDQLDAATNYIKRQKIKIEELREKKENMNGL